MFDYIFNIINKTYQNSYFEVKNLTYVFWKIFVNLI